MLSCVLEENELWGNYRKVCEELTGETDFQSQTGGYPKWIQEESSPRKTNGDILGFIIPD
jgi:hypothetical protein